MQSIKNVNSGLCLAMVVLFLIPSGHAMAATRAKVETLVTPSELYDAMSVRTREEAAARGVVQKLLGKAEVRRVAADAGLDIKQVQAAVSVLSGEELQAVANQARRVDETLAGEGSVVITSTAVIIGLLVLILLVVV